MYAISSSPPPNVEMCSSQSKLLNEALIPLVESQNSRSTALGYKVAFCLLEDLTAFCLKISLRFASRPHCVLLQDLHCVLLEDLTAFCLKTSLRFASRPHCVLLQVITAFCFNITAFCSRPPLRFA
ncbi:hypothetical protein Tco_0398174 [Tanacetum coccineum]